MNITIAQQNYIIGNFDYNTQKIIEACKKNENSDLIIFSELAVSGYYPWDLLTKEYFIKQQKEAITKIVDYTKNINSYVVFGAFTENLGHGKALKNSAIIAKNGEIVAQYDKQLLPTYNIFDESRHFQEGKESAVININGKKIGFVICEDGWNDDGEDKYQLYVENPIKQSVDSGAEIIVSLNASPSTEGKKDKREAIYKKIVQKYGVDCVYVNQVGGYDEIVFDGSSFVYQNGKKTMQLPSFQEATANYDFNASNTGIENEVVAKEEFHLQQIITGLKDYLLKTGFKKVVVGSSGGIDSALTMAIASIAIGSENVIGVTMPSKYSSEGSVKDSEKLCENIGVRLFKHPIQPIVDVEKALFKDVFNESYAQLTEENVQARIRGQILMSYSNQYNSLLVSTGNKSELSVGYCTLYGDTNGGINLIGDLYKTEVFALSRYINAKYGELIPEGIINKEPSAELSENQKDSDSLPPYEQLDEILRYLNELEYLEQEAKEKVTNFVKQIPEDVINGIVRKINISEFKRRQSPLIVKIKELSFGNGRIMPISHQAKFKM